MSISDKITLFTTPSTWIEGESIRQLERVAALPGMLKVAGFPDLHPGKGGPVGAAMLSEGVFYPYLVGSDVGCGMALFATDLNAAKAKPEKWAKKLKGLEEPWDGDAAAWLQERGAEAEGFASSAGTIGMGNHFAELLKIKEIIDPDYFTEAGLHNDSLFLLVHSGSRGLGERLLRSHVDVHRDGGLKTDSKDSYEESRRYLKAHDNCLRWAQASRELIAHRFLEQLGSGYHRIIDRIHNSITIVEGIKRNFYLHRKGVSPLVTFDEPFYRGYPISPASSLVIIPGSRGTPSYLVRPSVEEINQDHLYSVAHGAGRKWGRNECEGRLREKYSADSMKKTKLGSYVICEDKDLLYEEAPQAYKDIDSVISDMVSFGLISVVAVFEPVLTYKVKK
jgi:release factor H-coupled RctB family protein